jgi:Tol biopolymer transport system component
MISHRDIFILILISYFLTAGISCGSSTDPVNDNGIPVPDVSRPDVDAYPSWMPDGSSILYYHVGIDTIINGYLYTIDSDSDGLWVADTSGTKTHQLLKGMRLYGEVSPAGDRLVFADRQIYTAQISEDSLVTSSIKILTNSGNNFFPAWSPDGASIAYESNINYEPGYRVWTMDDDGSNNRVVADGIGGSTRKGDWFPDGERIVFIGFLPTKENTEILTVRSDGTDIQQLTHNNADEARPKVSPDGTKIVYECGASICIMNSDGTGAYSLINGRHPDWSPDGKRIVFLYTPPDEERHKGTVWTMDIHGRNLKQVTFGTQRELTSLSSVP